MAPKEINYWLMKSEPDAYSIKDLQREEETLWDGIRNYQARNFMRSMAIGDKAFFYHSNCNPPGIIGFMEVIERKIVDPTQFDSTSKYFYPKSTKENPIWDCVRLKYLGKFENFLSLTELKKNYSDEQLLVVKKGNRLSILPIPNKTAHHLLKLLGPFI